MISHKRTFFENIASYDDAQIEREIRRLLTRNRKDNRSFDTTNFRDRLEMVVTPERAARIMESVLRPHEGDPIEKPAVVVTGADLSRGERKTTKRKMRSRRKSR